MIVSLAKNFELLALPKKLSPPLTPFLTPYKNCGVKFGTGFFSSEAAGAIVTSNQIFRNSWDSWQVLSFNVTMSKVFYFSEFDGKLFVFKYDCKPVLI